MTLQNRVQSYNKKMKNTNYSVKKYQTYGILILALLFCSTVHAKINHFVGGYAQVGEWSLMPQSSEYKSSLGAAGGAGVLYELQSGKAHTSLQFLFDVGVGATYGMTAYNSKSKNEPMKVEEQYDLDNEKFDYIYDIRDRKDQYSNLALHFPVLIGVQYRRLYALVGVRFYANMLTKIHSTATLTTYGEYWNDDHTKKRYDDFRNMPEYQFFTDEPLKKSQDTHFKLDADLSLEIGARLGIINYSVGYDVPKRKLEYRIGAFMDYGLFDVHTSGNMKPLVVPKTYNAVEAYHSRTMVDNVQMNDVMRMKGFAKKVQNLMVGVRFTVLFQMPEQQKCVMCDDGYKSTVTPARGGGGVKYEE